jgi:cytochrome c553
LNKSFWVHRPDETLARAINAMTSRSFFTVLLATVSFASALKADDSAATAKVDFVRDVAPILEQRCIRCHKPGNDKSKLSLATLADLTANEYIVPGDPEASYLLEVVSAAGSAKPLMPKEGPPLTAEEVERLRVWIAEGAHWPADLVIQEKSKADRNWWSLRPLASSEPPSDEIPAAWSANPIDRFVYARLIAAGLEPNPPADRRTLIRRVSYSLTGLPPEPKEVAAFVADDSPDAYEKLVDRLLASPRYGEHWGRHWLDVVRFGESTGFEVNHVIDNAWPFRDYVIQSLNEDKPFDQLVTEHLAGDAVGPGDLNVEVGLTFLVCGPVDIVGNSDAAQAAQIRADTVDEMIRATGEAFIGLTIGCARCHDHKFDPISQRDYYRLYATFAGVYHDDRSAAPESPPLRIGRFEQPTGPQHVFQRGDANRKGEQVDAASISTLEHVGERYELASDSPEQDRRLALARWIVAGGNPLPPRVLVNRLWHYHFGTGIVATPSDFGYMGSPPTHPELLDWLARRLLAEGWKLKPLHKLIVMSEAYRQSSAHRDDAAQVDADARLLWRFPPRRLAAEEIRDTVLLLAGKLDERPGGPGFRLYEYTRDNVATYTPLEKFGPGTYRRSVYHQNARASLIDVLTDFDAPDCAFSSSRRIATTTPSQALALMNHSFTMDMAQAFAERLASEAGEGGPAAQVALAFELAFARHANSAEQAAATALVKEHGLRALCRAMLNSSELIYMH